MFDMVFNPKWTTLKKLIWLKATILSGVAHIIQTVTGNAPLTLANAVAHALKSLTQTGLCTQASTPTPSTPVDIYCNNGVVKYGALGTNLLNAETDIVGAYLNADGEPVAGGSNYRYSDIIPVKAGKYVFSGTANPTSGQTKRVHGYANGVWQSQLAATYVAKDAEFSVSITVPSGVNGIRVSYYTGDVDAQVTKGSTVPPYAPYVGGIYVDGTPEVLTIGNQTASVQNLFGVGDYADTQEIISGAVTRNVGIKVFDGTENWTRTASGDGFTVFSIVANAHSIPGWSKITSLSTNFECYVGSTAPTYIAANAGKFWLNTSGQYFRFVIEGTMDLAQFKAWLADQYAAGTPVIVLYPMATETTESVDGQALSTAAGTNVVSVTAEVSPIALECEYYATE